ncbi:MAG: SDR family NAD(P)-dependent oxidoreductase, partial [Planctomycetota bacterium]
MHNDESADSAPVAVITGAVDGIGGALAKRLAAKGWRLVLLNRSEERTQPLLDELRAERPDVECVVFETDLALHASIESSARRVRERHDAVDALFHNAGVLRNDLAHSTHGNELHFEINTVAPYLLTNELLPTLKQAANRRGRAVVVTPSTAALKSVRRFDVAALRTGTRAGLLGAYAESKFAWSVLNAHLADVHALDGVEFFAIDPGATRTRMTGRGSSAPWPVRLLWRWLGSPSDAAARLVA